MVVARSASDRTDDWPFWFIADWTGVSVTIKFFPELRGRMPFVSRSTAESAAEHINDALARREKR